MKKFAVVLSGCGVFDGAEIHEATMTLLAIKKQGSDYDIFAPNIPQHHVINHITGEEMNEKRNVLIESARIARGKISDLKSFKSEDYDALIFPGGFGAAKNLSSFAFKGADSEVNPDVENAIRNMFNANKPIGALCIAPAVLAKVLGNIEVTIGQDAGTAKQIEKTGAKHIPANNGEVVIDVKNKIFTNPCYMLEASIVDIEVGAQNVVEAMMRFIN